MSTIKKILSLVMALILTVGVGTGALAYTTPDFTDVASGNWAYAPVMKMADAGIIKGSSSTTFSPEVKISPAMWLTLVGRAVYEADVKAAAQAGDEWFTAYVRVAQAKGLTTGTNITDENLQGEMTRYDMAATVYAAIKLLGAKDATVDTTTIKDYGDIPQKYLAAVGQMYATGLIKGDNAGNFNGNATMTRAEAAAVMSRLIDFKAKLAETPTEPEKPVETIPPRTGEMITVEFDGHVSAFADGMDTIENPKGVLVIFCIKDGRELGRATTDADGKYEMVATIDRADYYLTENQYYIDAYYTDPDGLKYSNVSKSGVKNLNRQLYDAIHGSWSFTVYNLGEYYVTDF